MNCACSSKPSFRIPRKHSVTGVSKDFTKSGFFPQIRSIILIQHDSIKVNDVLRTVPTLEVNDLRLLAVHVKRGHVKPICLGVGLNLFEIRATVDLFSRESQQRSSTLCSKLLSLLPAFQMGMYATVRCRPDIHRLLPSSMVPFIVSLPYAPIIIGIL